MIINTPQMNATPYLTVQGGDAIVRYGYDKTTVQISGEGSVVFTNFASPSDVASAGTEWIAATEKTAGYYVIDHPVAYVGITGTGKAYVISTNYEQH